MEVNKASNDGGIKGILATILLEDTMKDVNS